ncbi:MAG TPA: lipocalin-like domain-containing protein [Polyangiales bacterium]
MNEQQNTIRNRLIGNWELTQWTRDGAPFKAFGRSPRGHLMYAQGGQMSALLLNSDRLPLSHGGDAIPPKQVLASPRSWLPWLSIYAAHLSYCGRFELSGSSEVLHHVEAASVPNWIGGIQRRQLEFIGDDLILTSSEPRPHQLSWRRIA